MPPHPICNEHNGSSLPFSASSHTSSQNLHTHSNKFPIERQVFIVNENKHSKIPILNDYMKKANGTIAPDLPQRQTAAWIQEKSPYLNTISPNATQAINIIETRLRRINNVTEESNWESQTEPILLNPSSKKNHILESNASNIECSNTKTQSHVHQSNYYLNETKLSRRNLTKTYQAIKCILSNKLKNSNESDNIHTQELNNAIEGVTRKVTLDTFDASNVLSNFKMQHRSNEEDVQKYLTEPNVLQSQINTYQDHQHLFDISNNIMEAKSALKSKKDCEFSEDCFDNTVIRSHKGTTDAYVHPPHLKINDGNHNEDGTKKYNTNLSKRRAFSQPQLLKKSFIPTNLPQSEFNKFNRESEDILSDLYTCFDDKNWDDSEFLNSCSSVNQIQYNKIEDTAHNHKADSKDGVEIHGYSRKILESEIGNIQGVYSVGLRTMKEFNSDSRLQTIYKTSACDKVGKLTSNLNYEHKNATFNNGQRLISQGDAHVEKYHSNDIIYSNTQLNDSEWVDIVEGELDSIEKPKKQDISENITNSTISESMSSITPPLPPLSSYEQLSPNVAYCTFPKNEMMRRSYEKENISDAIQTDNCHERYINTSQKFKDNRIIIQDNMLIKQKQKEQEILDIGLDNTDFTSSTTRSMHIESILDVHSESDGHLSSYGVRTIKKQLEGLEGMYAEVLKLLGVKKSILRYQPSDPHFDTRRYGSISSLPSSSISSRPMKDKRRLIEDRKKVRDMKGINKRFQRLESHVVTLARSVAHLSSEMRTQHLMIQEIENIRSELSTLRMHTNMLNLRSQSTSRSMNILKKLPTLANPTRVKKLKKFFGDEPPLLRLFLRNMGYEKYASIFEKESIGMIELPYLSEEQLHKLGIPLGPRLRIMEEVHISAFKDNTLCIV